MRRGRTSSFVFATVIAALGLAPETSVAQTVVVTPANMGNWAFTNADGFGVVGNNPTGNGGMVTGPGTPPLGMAAPISQPATATPAATAPSSSATADMRRSR